MEKYSLWVKDLSTGHTMFASVFGKKAAQDLARYYRSKNTKRGRKKYDVGKITKQ